MFSFHFYYNSFLLYLTKFKFRFWIIKKKTISGHSWQFEKHWPTEHSEQNRSPSNTCPVRFQNSYRLESVYSLPFFPSPNGYTYYSYLSLHYSMYSTGGGRQRTYNVQTDKRLALLDINQKSWTLSLTQWLDEIWGLCLLGRANNELYARRVSVHKKGGLFKCF